MHLWRSTPGRKLDREVDKAGGAFPSHSGLIVPQRGLC
jgi:hypothetical protein